ncbi:MAG: hypothetical protein WBK13_05405 [Limnochordia bacterium]|nr:hypothetical protein [Bacillota bacterium]
MVIKRFLSMLLLSVLIVSLTGCGGGGGGGTGTSAKAQISALTDAFIQVWFEQDVDALRSSEFFTS